MLLKFVYSPILIIFSLHVFHVCMSWENVPSSVASVVSTIFKVVFPLTLIKVKGRHSPADCKAYLNIKKGDYKQF